MTAMKTIKMECPYCGSPLQVWESKNRIKCPYCGNMVLIDDGVVHKEITINQNININSTIHNIDDAKVKEAEINEKTKMKQLEMEEKENNLHHILVVVWIVVIVVALLLSVIGFSSDNEGLGGISINIALWGGILGYIYLSEHKESEMEKTAIAKGLVRAPGNEEEFKKQYCGTVKNEFLAAGFTNVDAISLNDLITGLINRQGSVESVTINGRSAVSNKWYPHDAHVVIRYHDFG